ncbi:MAG TPA: agmatinase [Anaerovoracaceae bacterium]|nr:agmatinase [Anaerovoracaceae bacterium]
MIDLKPWGDLNTEKAEDAKVCIMGIPFDGAVSCGKGTALAPEKIRTLSRYLPATTETGQIIKNLKAFDMGDVAIDLDWARYYQKVEDEACNLMREGKFSLFIGGDHSVTIPLHRAFGRYSKEAGRTKIGVIHFDSHADICDTYDSHKWSHACTERRTVEDVISPEDLAYLGLRSYEIEELEYFDAHPEVLVMKAYDVFRDGYMACYKKLEEKFKDYDAVYFTLDIDVVDPAFAPGTGTPEAGGLTSREILELTKLLLGNLPVKAMDIVEVSPPLDQENDITSWLALKIIYEVFGCLERRKTV